MLNQITIKNLAVVDFLDLELNAGLSVLTGETGAGKSILIDALGLVLGDRADASAIRYGAQRADITAHFELKDKQIEQWLNDNDLDSDGECIIRRTISVVPDAKQSGNSKARSRGYINGQPIPLQTLKELGEKLVNIHGQNTHQALLNSTEQCLLLDNFAGINVLREQVNKHYRLWKKKSSQYDILKNNRIEQDAKLDLLRFQVNEFNDFDLQENELITLEEEHKKLSNANRLIEASQMIYHQLTQDEQNSVTYSLGHSINELQTLSELDNQLNPLLESLNSALIQVDEVSSELRHYIDSLELDPTHLQFLDQRISDIYDLARKHRVESQDLYAHSITLQTELDQLENVDSHLETLFAEVEQAQADYFASAQKLSKQRKKAATLLSEQVITQIHELGMQQCIFAVQLIDCDSELPQLQGMESIEFYVTTNPGQPLKPLSKVVSGGELSRISLAIQVVTAQFSDIATLIFDEVDVGIGGGIAEMVGKKLRLLAGQSQILCVTHQAQVASQAHQHLHVYKQNNADSTHTHISQLDESERIEELSRMMGGITITEQTRSHAKEMLNQVSE